MEISGEDYEIWFEGIDHPTYSRTTLPEVSDYIIVGGGMAGITAAYQLTKAGKKVVVLEKEKIGRHVTSATTAFLTYTIDTEPQTLIKKFGLENARLVLEAHKKAIDEIEAIIQAENIECEFERCTNYIYANDEKEEKHLLKLAEGYNKLGVAAEYKKENRLKFNEFGYIEMPSHGRFHAIKYLTALAKITVSRGAIIAEETEVLNLVDGKDGVNVEIKDVGIIKAKKVVSATYQPFKKPKHLSRLYNMYREYVVEFKLPKDKFMAATYEDTRVPYNYFRIDKKNSFDRLIIGGADHLAVIKMDKEINFQTMRTYAEGLFNKTNLEEMRHWSGNMIETVDGLAFIGESKGGNIFYIFGFSGNGMTYSSIGGRIILDEIQGRENPYKKVYHVDRKISFWTKFLL